MYRGEWKNNNKNGKGIYEFPNGTIYDGEFEDNVMHGSGWYIDHTGRKWEGEFRNGSFETKRQS